MLKSKLDFTPHQLKVIQSDNHVALTANAGSGKTFVLKYKYLNAAKKLNGDISKIAAITFTNKAAAELYKKISELVNDEITATTDSSQLRILYKIRRSLVSANISTIHSFCIEILKNYPVEAGVDANFIPIDQSKSDELIDLSINECLDSLFNDEVNSTILKELIRFFGSRTQLESEFKKLIKSKKNVNIIKESIYHKTVDEITEYFDKTFYFLVDELKKIFDKDLINLIQTVNNIVLSSDAANKDASSIKKACDDFIKNQDFLLFLKTIKELMFTKSGDVKKKGYLSKVNIDDYSELIIQLEKLLSKLKILTEIDLNLNLHKELAELGKKIIFIFNLIHSSYENKKRKNSFIDFYDILIKTQTLLKNENVRKELSEKYHYLMVDEYQDTDEIQYNIFLPILNELKSGNLFIVGDDKQSIYRFRDADLKVFDKTREDISNQNRESGLQLLPDSFRMTKELCLFTNYVFNKLFHSSIPLFHKLKNVPIISAYEKDDIGKVEFLVSDEKSENVQTQSELTALKILELVQNGEFKFSQIAVLVTKRKHFDELEKVFALRSIPYKIVGGRGYFQRQIISDIRNYLSFISNPNDDVSLVAILRSPFFMLSDSEILKISLFEGKSFYEKFKNFSLTEKKYYEIIHKLETQINKCSFLPISRLIREIISDSDFLFIIKNRHNGDQEIANVEKLLSIAKDFDEGGFNTLYDFVKFLVEAEKNKADEAQEEGLLSESGVQLMTIHQAKGLEFPVVFLYRCEDEPKSSASKAKEITVNKELGLLFKVPSKDDPSEEYLFPPILVINNFIEDSKDLAEIKRLLYVGVTRAINNLIIVYNKKYNSKSFISSLNEALTISSPIPITIEDDVILLRKKDDSYYNITEHLNLSIRVTSFIDEKNIKHHIKENVDREYIIDLNKLERESEYQIISASKISVFEKCPIKYHLTYNIGLAKLFKLLPDLKKQNKEKIETLSDLIRKDEDEIIVNSDRPFFSNADYEKFGQIIHELLEKNIPLESTKEYLSKKNENEEHTNQVINLLKVYYDSEVFKEINKYNNYKNEFEITLKEENVILKGIIDKIIFREDSILIIDYKTDNVEEENALKHYSQYEIQMKFYLYISMRFFEKIDKFSSRIIFLRNPDLYFDLDYNREKISDLKAEIFGLIKGIIDNKLEKNLNHCPNCIYFINNKKCIYN